VTRRLADLPAENVHDREAAGRLIDWKRSAMLRKSRNPCSTPPRRRCS